MHALDLSPHLPMSSSMQRNWMDHQATEEALVGWPDKMMENFAVVGLAPDMEIMDLIQIAEDLCGAQLPPPATHSMMIS